MTNKVPREKTNCVIFQSSKSRILKQKHNNKKSFQRQHKSSNSFFKLQEKHAYVLQKLKKYTGNLFPKKLISISKPKIKGKSKCVIWLTKRTFIHKIEDEYALESELEIFLPFFTD